MGDWRVDYQIEVFDKGKWEPLYGTDTDGRHQDSLTPQQYVEVVGKLGLKVRVAPHILGAKEC